jgi:hypothetical protein
MRAIRQRGYIMKRSSYITGAAVICAIAFIIYLATRPPGGVTPMGDESSATIASVSLVTAVVSLLATIVGFIQRLFELRAGKGG